MLGGAHPAIGAVLEAARPETTLVHGIHTAPPVRPVRQNVVLLGDAAHAMAPNLGHGANTALVDAATLAASLHGAGGGTRAIEGALRRYAWARTVPGQLWRLGSETMLRLAMLERSAPLRDRLIGAVSAVTP